jgi:hypothetical protein
VHVGAEVPTQSFKRSLQKEPPKLLFFSLDVRRRRLVLFLPPPSLYFRPTRCAPLSELQRVLAWCDAQPGLHLVSDEIYALSVFGPGAKHVSVAALGPGPATLGTDGNRASPSKSGDGDGRSASTGGAPLQPALGPYRHVLWGLSKDWGVSGFRVGVAWTQNQPLYDALCNAAVFTSVPGPVQVRLQTRLRPRACGGWFGVPFETSWAGAECPCCVCLFRGRP